MWKLIKYLFLLTFVFILVAPPLFMVALLEDRPSVPAAVGLTHADLARAKSLLEENDPRQMREGEIRSVSLSEDDLNLMFRYLLKQQGGDAYRGELDLRHSFVDLKLSIRLPDNPIGRYLNIRTEISPQMDNVGVNFFEVGVVNLPPALTNAVIDEVHARLSQDEVYLALLDTVNGVRITEQRALLVFQWRPDVLKQAKSRGVDLLVSADEKARLLAYTAEISRVSRDPLMSANAPLIRFLEPLFTLAGQRSAGGDPVAENRALISALGMYFNGLNVPRLLNEADSETYHPLSRQLVLNGREDFAQHFVISAAVTTSGGGKLADAVGLFKEVDDSQGGSGFSFNDLAADRAGVRFAEAATRSRSSATALQRLFQGGAVESDFMPSVRDLPEFMAADEFEDRFGGVGAPAYNEMLQRIEARIAALPIHR